MALAQSKEQSRVEQALAFLNQGLAKSAGEGIGFVSRTVYTDPFGETHVRATQTYRGVPVYGAEVIVHVRKDGQDPDLTGEAYPVRLQEGSREIVGADRAVDLAKYSLWPITRAGLKELRFEAQKVLWLLPQAKSEENARWAYLVRYTPSTSPKPAEVEAMKRWKEPETTDIILCAQTGQILDKWFGLPAQTPGTGRGSIYKPHTVHFRYDNLDSWGDRIYPWSMISAHDSGISVVREKDYYSEYAEWTRIDDPWGEGVWQYVYHEPRNVPYTTPAPSLGLGNGLYIPGTSHFYEGASSRAVDVMRSADAVHLLCRNHFGWYQAFNGANIYLSTQRAKQFGNNFCTDANSVYLYDPDISAQFPSGVVPGTGASASVRGVSTWTVGHELGHALVYRTANFVYSVTAGDYYAKSESAALHEANAEIMGTLASVYGRENPFHSTIITPLPDSPATQIFSDDYLGNNSTASTRGLYWELLNIWYGRKNQQGQFYGNYFVDRVTRPFPSGKIEVHEAGYPFERWFFLLAYGCHGDANLSDRNYHPDPQKHFSENGLHWASKIWFRGLTVYCKAYKSGPRGPIVTDSKDYLSAMVQAAADIDQYMGFGSRLQNAVKKANLAIGAGEYGN